jgi:hypothetical protein
MKMKMSIWLIPAILILTATTQVSAQQVQEKSMQQANEFLQKVGRDANKATQEAKTAISQALKANRDGDKESLQGSGCGCPTVGLGG